MVAGARQTPNQTNNETENAQSLCVFQAQNGTRAPSTEVVPERSEKRQNEGKFGAVEKARSRVKTLIFAGSKIKQVKASGS